jgi:hypothetical protein
MRPDEVIFLKKKLYGGIGEPAQYASTKRADAI